jgi:hypothetical protein
MQFNAGYIPDEVKPNFITPDKTILDFVNPFQDAQNFNPQIQSGGGDPLASAFSNFARKGMSESTMAAPTFYDWKGSNADRYVNTDYYRQEGFDPFVDNESKYGYRQTWGNMIGNAFAGAGKLAWQTFKSGWEGWADMANALFSWDSSKLAGSPEDLKEMYDTQNEIMNKYAIYSTPESQNSIFNKQFFGNMLQQSGFAVGATAQFLSEELLTMGASSALSAGKFAVEGAAFTNRAIKFQEMLRDFTKLGEIWKENRVVDNLLSGAKRLIPLSETGEDIGKAWKALDLRQAWKEGRTADVLKGTAQLGYIGAGGLKRALSEANMSMSEARMEAAGTYGDLNKRLTDEYIAQNGQAPVGADADKIQKMSYKAGLENFWVNSGVLMAMNRIQFDNLFSKFGSERKLLNEMGDMAEHTFSVTRNVAGQETTRVFEKGMFGAAGKFSDIAATFGRRAAAWEATKSAAKGIFKWETSEGVQEILQDLSNNTLQDYYYDLYHGAKGYSYGRSLDRAVKQEESISGAQTFLMGALTGRLLSPFTYGMEKGVERVRTTSEQRNKIDLERKDVISTLNAFYQDPNNFFKNAIANFKGQEGAAFNMQEAVKNRDQYTWQNYKDSALASLISSAKKTGMIDSVLDTIRAYGDHIQGDQLKEAYGIDPTEENIKDTKAYFNSVADRAGEYSKNFDILKDKYGDLINPDLFKEGSAGHIQALFAKRALDDAIEILATNRFKSDRAMDRVKSIYSELQQNKNIGQSAASAVHTLASEEEVTKQMALLKEELKGLNDNPTKNADIHQQIEYKQAQLEALTNWKDNYSAWDNQHVTEKIKNEAAKDAWQKYVTAKNQEAGLSTVISNDDINDSFEHLAHYTQLNQDHKEYIDAYNTLANPKRFVMLHGKMMDAMNRVRELFRTEHEQELEQTGAAPKNSFTMTGTDDEGKEYSIDINEGDHYVTDANEDKVIFKGKVAKTFNNNLIKILKIDGDNVTIQVNNGKTYEVSKDRLAKAGKLWNLKDMNADARIYFKNRDMVLPINVNSKTGKPHLINGEYAKKDYSKGGVNANARLVLVKENGEQVLKLQYKNPVTGKIETMNYNKEYLLKYGDGKINLRTMPSEEQEQQRKNQERLKNNYDTQLKIFQDRVAEANTQIEQAKVNRQQNEETFQRLRQQLMDDRTELELVKEELEKYEGKKGRKSNLRKSLEENRDRLVKSITEAQDHIDKVKQERENLDNTIKALKSAQDLYEMAALELMDTGAPFDRNGGDKLSSNAQDQHDQLSENQMTARFNKEQVDQMVEDTQNEINNLDHKINSLEGYVKDLKNILRGITDINDFLDFMDMPEGGVHRKTMRDYLRKKIEEAPDDASKERYQKMMNQFLKNQSTHANDIIFLLSSMRDSLRELDTLGKQMDEQQQKMERLKTAQQQKAELSSLADRIDFLNQVQDVLTADKHKAKPVLPVKGTPEHQEGLVSDVEIESDPESQTYKDKKPRFEEVGFNKTFGRHYIDQADTEVNTADGSDRFFDFTGRQNVMNQGYELMAVTEHNDEFGIRQTEHNPNDIKLVVVKKDEKGNVSYIGKDGKVLENPSKDNIVYRSMADINSWTVERVRKDYTVHPDTTDAQIQQKIDEHKAYQKNLVERSKEGPVYLKAVSTSPGIDRVERTHEGTLAKAEAEGRVIEDDPAWDDLRSAHNPEANIALVVATGDGQLSNGSQAPGVLAGRVVTQEYTHDGSGNKRWGDKISRVFNRALNIDEKKKVVEALVRLSQLFGRKDHKDPALRLTAAEEAEYDLIFSYLKNVLPWGGWKNGGNSQRRKPGSLFRIDNGLKRGDNFSIPFDEENIRKNQEELLKDVFHNVNNRTLQKNEGFRDIAFKDGRVIPGRQFDTYQEYLLAKRENGELPPVYTSLPRADSATPQRTSAYLNWVDPHVQFERAESPYSQPQKREADLQNPPATPAPVATPAAVQQQPASTSLPAPVHTQQISYKGNLQGIPTNSDVAFALNPTGTKLIGQFDGNEFKVNKILTKDGRDLTNSDNPAVAQTLEQHVPFITDALREIKNGTDETKVNMQKKALQDTYMDISNVPVEKSIPVASAVPAPVVQAAAPQAVNTQQKKIQEMSAPKVAPNGELKYYTIEDAMAAAQMKNGKLSTTLHVYDEDTGEEKPLKAEVVIPDGKLKAAQIALKMALMQQISNEEEGPVFREVISREQFDGLEDFRKLSEFMKENLPQIPVKKVGDLIHGKAYGAFMKGAVYIYNKAEIGTGYHEAFEAVWASYLQPEEREALINEFRSRKGEFENPFSRETKPYSQASLYDAREVMAEEFRHYILRGEFPENAPKAKGFFQKLWDFIKRLLGMDPDVKKEFHASIHDVFEKIRTGGFKDHPSIREQSEQFPVYKAVGGLTQEETAQAIEGLGYYFFRGLYNDGKNMDSLLNRHDPKLSNELLSKLFNEAHDAVVKNAAIIGKRVVEELQNNKQDLYSQFKKSISRFGLDFNEHDDLLVKEEKTDNALGIRDSISVDPKKMSAVNVKLLLASLPMTTNRKGNVKLQYNLQMNQPRLEDYSRVHNILLNELSNLVTVHGEDGSQHPMIAQMFEKLDSKYRYPSGNYRDGYGWIRSVKVRLRYEDVNGEKVPVESLSQDDIMLQVAFVKSFTNAKTTPQNLIVGENGYIYSMNPIGDTNIKRVRESWSNNLKTAIMKNAEGLVKVNPSGMMELNRNSQDYHDLMGILANKQALDLEKALAAYKKMGIEFSGTTQQLNENSVLLNGTLLHILTQMNEGAINNVTDLYGNNVVSGRINDLLDLEATFSAEDGELSYRNADGEQQYSVSIPSLLSNTINILNTVRSQKELVQSAPWLGYIDDKGEAQFYAYQQNSELLKKGGLLFNTKGNRKKGNDSKMAYQVISGMTTLLQGTSTAKLQFPDRVANEIHYLLNNTVFSVINSDKSTEFGIGIPGKQLLVSKEDIDGLLHFNNSKVTDKYIAHLSDEMNAAVVNKYKPSSVQYYAKQVRSLGHFKDILGDKLVSQFQKEVLDSNKYPGPKGHERFIEKNRAAIADAINKYILAETDKTVSFLKKLDLFTKQGTVYTTDAIDNNLLADILKTSETYNDRQAFTENNLRTLAGILVTNKELLTAEQHKLIYGHPAYYKDLAKRANGATSTKEQMVDDPSVLKWMDANMPRLDGKSRSEEAHPTISIISFKDQNVVSAFYQEIADAIGENQVYQELNEADAMAWGMPDMVRDMLFLTGKLTKEQMAQFDYETAYEKLALSKLNPGKYEQKELEAAQQIVDKGDPGYVFQVLKPQYFGFAVDENSLHPVFLKHSVQPKFFRHVEGTQFEKLFLAARKNQMDLIGFESGEKVGNVLGPDGEFTPLYNDLGEINIVEKEDGYDLPSDLAKQQLYSRFYGIQVETSAKPKNEVVRGTQVTKLIMVNFFENGNALDEKVAQVVTDYNKTLEAMMDLGKKKLLKELGLKVDEHGNYETEDLNSLVGLLRKEAESRDLPDNMIDGISSILEEDGSHSLKYKFDTLINREKIDNILNSIIDSRVISEKMNGKASVQVASTLYESSPRDFLYLKDGKYTQLNKADLGSLTKEERDSIRMQSSDLKFYTNKDGKLTSMEVYIAWPYKDVNPEDLGLKLENGIYKLSGDSKVDDALLRSLGFRIPTQGMNSIESLRIKGFTPATNGDMIVVPSELVGKSGSDFDIDKMNLYLPNYRYNSRSGKVEAVPFLTNENSTVQERYLNYVKDSTRDYRNIISSFKYSEEYLTKQERIQAAFDKAKGAQQEVDAERAEIDNVYQEGYEIFSDLPLAIRQQYYETERDLNSRGIEGLDKIATYLQYTKQWKDAFADGMGVQLEESHTDKKGNTTKQVVVVTPQEVNSLFDQLMDNYRKTADAIGVSEEAMAKVERMYADAKFKKDLLNENFRISAASVIAEATGLPSLEEFSHLPIEKQNNSKALQNRFMDLMHELVLHPANYEQLVTPNGVDDIKGLATKISKLKVQAGTKSEQNEKSPTFLRSFVGASQIRERYLTAKRMVGIAALQSTFHSMAQVAGTRLMDHFKTDGIYYLMNDGEENKAVTIKLRHNAPDESGQFSVGHKLDAEGKLISENMSQKLTGFVDGAKDPFVFDLNLNMDTAATWFLLDHLGVPQEDTAYFFNQPVLDSYFDNMAQNNSSFKKINGNKLTREELFLKTVAPYFEKLTGVDLMEEIVNQDPKTKAERDQIRFKKKGYIAQMRTIATEIEQFSLSEMEKGIKGGKDHADPKLQIAVMFSYLEHNAQAQLLGNYIKAIGYDNSRTKSIQENQLQVANWQRSLKEGFVANPNAILEKTFIGEMKKHKEDVFNMYKQFFVTMSERVQKVFKPLEDKINDPDYLASGDDKGELLNRYQNFVLAYLLHTTPFVEENKVVTLNKLYKQFFQGDDSMAKLLQRYKNSSDTIIRNNRIIQELLPMMNRDTNLTDNIALFRNKLDTYQVNQMIEELDNLRNYAQETADDELESFANNLAKFSIMQNGFQSGRTDYRKVLSTSIYSDLVNNILDHFDAIGKELDPYDVWRKFHQNNWRNGAIVQKVPDNVKVKQGRILISEKMSVTSNMYLLKYTFRPGLQRNQIDELLRQKRGDEVFIPMLFERKRLLDNGKWLYESIPMLGDGTRFLEIPSADEDSILPKNGKGTTPGSTTPEANTSGVAFAEQKSYGPEEVNTNENSYNSTTPQDTIIPAGSEVRTALDKLDGGCKSE